MNLKDFITSQEGIAYKAYKDASGTSIGVGHFLTPAELSTGTILIEGNAISWKDGLTLEQIMALLDQDITRVREQLRSAVKVKLTEGQENAIIDFTFNLGIGHLNSSTLLKRINAGAFAEVPTELAKWNLSDGKINPGLVARRAAECKMWEGI